ncbi:MAG: HAD-IB family phosphatase, partial [Thermacetogeniaceae bacterium]
MKRVFFLDFDGTITKIDTCFLMVNTFAGDGWKEIDEQWERKEITTEECASLTFKLFRADLDDVRKLIETVEIDDYFMEFLDLCRKQGDDVYVLSDGYDLIIDMVFKRYGIEVPYYANRMIYEDGFQIACPYLNPDCGQCGTCKSSLMKRLKGDAEQV